MGKLKTLQARALEVAEMKLDSPELDQRLEAALSGAGNSSGNSPVSPESIPAR